MSILAGRHIVIVPAWWPSPEQPAAGIFFTDYAQAFADADARVGVIVPDLVSLRRIARSPFASLIPRMDREVLRDDIPVVRVRGLHTAFGRPGLHMKRFRAWLERGLDAYRSLYGEPNILHAMCSIPAGWAATTIAGPLARRVVITEHFGPFSAQLAPRAGGLFVREALDKAAAVVTVSERSRSDMRAAGIAREITVIDNAVGREFLDAEVPTSRDGPVQALFVGRLTPEKGVRELAEAAALLAVEMELHWSFVGIGRLHDEVRRRLDDAGRSGACQLHGELDRAGVIEQMRAADFLVLPSHAETFGMVVAEALCMGLPVIVTRGTACEAFVDESNGLLVEPHSGESLLAGLRRMVQTARSYDRRRIAAAARARFEPTHLAKAYQPIFANVADVPPD